MAVLIQGSAQKYAGASAETKPTDAAPGATWLGLDDGSVWIFDGLTWWKQPNATATAALAQLDSNEALANLSLELTALRLGMQEWLNEGRTVDVYDLREMAQGFIDRPETEEP